MIPSYGLLLELSTVGPKSGQKLSASCGWIRSWASCDRCSEGPPQDGYIDMTSTDLRQSPPSQRLERVLTGLTFFALAAMLATAAAELLIL